jgi:hypothetical protein
VFSNKDAEGHRAALAVTSANCGFEVLDRGDQPALAFAPLLSLP